MGRVADLVAERQAAQGTGGSKCLVCTFLGQLEGEDLSDMLAAISDREVHHATVIKVFAMLGHKGLNVGKVGHHRREHVQGWRD